MSVWLPFHLKDINTHYHHHYYCIAAITNLLGTHIEKCPDTISVVPLGFHIATSTNTLLYSFHWLVHNIGNKAEISNFDFAVQGEEDIRGLKPQAF